VRQVAESFDKYESKTLLLNQQPDASAAVALPRNPTPEQIVAAAETQAAQEEVELPAFKDFQYPTFPDWVMEGTSILENFVRPVCDHNKQRAPYFMWLAGETLLQNYLGTKLTVKEALGCEPFNGSQYIVIIGKRGEAIKSSCVDDALLYFSYMGCLAHNGGGLKTAEGKTVVWTGGSAEGVGIEAQKSNAKNILLFYDELSQLTDKAGIEGSTLVANLCIMYESKKFANTVKKGKEAYALEPGSYCASLISCTTDELFHGLWSKMNGGDSGLDNRFFFVVQPEVITNSPKVKVNFLENAPRTRYLIE